MTGMVTYAGLRSFRRSWPPKATSLPMARAGCGGDHERPFASRRNTLLDRRIRAGEQALPGVFDLACSEPFVPAPALVHVEPSEPLTDCGPLPP
jgi:hypothetical protein